MRISKTLAQSEMYPKTKKIHCVLCNGVVAFDKNSPERFSDHLKFDHEVQEGLDWVVAGSLISVETRQRVLEVIEKSTPFLRTSKAPMSDKGKESSEKAVIDIVLDDDEEQEVDKNTSENTEETAAETAEKSVVETATSETNDEKAGEDPPTETAEDIPEKVIIASKKIDISCKLCPYKATTNFGLNKHVKKIHPQTPLKNSGQDIIKLVQSETDKLIDSAKKKTGHYKETDKVSETENETGKSNSVYGDIHKMLVEETKTNRRKSLRKKKSEAEKLLEEKTDPEPSEKPTGKDSSQPVALEEMEKPRDETRQSTPVKEETVALPAKKKRRRTELKSDVQKSVDGSLADQSPQKVLSPRELQKLNDDVAHFSDFLTQTINEEKSNSENTSTEDTTKVSKVSDRKTKSKKRKRSHEEEEEKEVDAPEEQSEVEAEDLTDILSRREPEVDVSSSEYFINKRKMIYNISDQRLQDPSFIEKIHRDENLPPNWFNFVQFFSNGTRRVREFVTPDRRVIRSIDGVREFLLVSSSYTEEEVDTVMSRLSTKSRRSVFKQEIMT